jgi:hypothetical protein
MKGAKSIRRKSGVSGPFTPKGKRKMASGTRAQWVAAVACSLLSAPVAAQPQTGSTSSASVGISVSVAPSFKLMPDGPTVKNDAGYCIATNGEQMTLPVLLVEASGGAQAAGVSNPLPWCDAGHAASQDDDAKTRKPAVTLIIRPE